MWRGSHYPTRNVGPLEFSIGKASEAIVILDS
jgi:hypothetical protein